MRAEIRLLVVLTSTLAAASMLSAICVGPAKALSIERVLSPFTLAIEKAKAPKEWLDFCRRYPKDCDVAPSLPQRIELTDDNRQKLVAVNDWVNSHVKPLPDLKHWHVRDRWDYAEDGSGDCEDYALVKRRMLIGLGYPREALFVTIVWNKNIGHAVLTVRTDQGDFVLDVLHKKVLLWTKTGYDFVKRQSEVDQNQWVYIDGDPHVPAAVAQHQIGVPAAVAQQQVAARGGEWAP